MEEQKRNDDDDDDVCSVGSLDAHTDGSASDHGLCYSHNIIVIITCYQEPATVVLSKQSHDIGDAIFFSNDDGQERWSAAPL